MSTARGEPCPKCQRAPLLRFGTVNGRLSEELVEGCEHERTRRGLCRRCPKPLIGLHPNAVYCGEPCFLDARREKNRKYQRVFKRENLERVRERDREYQKRKRADELKSAREKARQRSPEYLAKAKLRSRARRRFTHPKYEETLKRRRAYYRRNKRKILAGQRRRRAEKRAEREGPAPIQRAA